MQLVERSILTQALANCFDPATRRKLELFLRAQDGVLKACKAHGKAPRYYYYWWNRYRDSGFRLEALQPLSRRPKRSPRRTAVPVRRLLEQWSAQGDSGPELKRRLAEEKGIRLSLATIYRSLAQSGRPRRRRTPARPKNSAAQVPAQAPPLGRVFGRYDLLRELGQGGSAKIYLAEDRAQGGRKVALKILKLAESTPALLAALRNEFQSLLALRHPHLARVLDFGLGSEEAFLSSEYLQGRILSAAAADLHLSSLFHLLVQILGALDHLHRQGILHLDLKPENILVLDAEGGELQAKLIDFGAAQGRHREGRGGDFTGTPPYAAPELLAGGEPSAASDLYSFGVLVCRIFGGAFPFSSQDPVEILKEQLYRAVPTLPPLPPSLPPEFGAWLRRLLEPEPSRRLGSARAALAELNAGLGESFRFLEESRPGAFLENSDRLFFPERFGELSARLAAGGASLTLLSAAAGGGKSHLLAKLKAALQLQGHRPWLGALEQAEALPDSEAGSVTAWLLEAGEDLPLESLGWSLDRWERKRVPVLIATSAALSPELNPPFRMSLPPLDTERLRLFLQTEIPEFPANRVAELNAAAEGSPRRLESLLQAMREEAWIVAGSRTWLWAEPDPRPFSELLPRREARWREWRRQAVHYLELTESGLETEALARLLELDPGELGRRLAIWIDEGAPIEARGPAGKPRYFAKASFAATAPRKASSADHFRLGEELSSLYAEGRFAAGIARIEAFLPSSARLPEELALIAARHLVAGGRADEALHRLPKRPPAEAGRRGLFWEIRCRALSRAGESSKAEAALREAERSYAAAGDELGRSRCWNLRGSLLRQAGDAEAARRAFGQAIEAAARGGDAYHRAMAEMNLALLQQDLGETESARATYAELLGREKEIAQPLLSCRLRQNWLYLLLYLGRSAEAETAAHDLLRRGLQAGDAEAEAAAYAALAQIAGQRGEHRRQLGWLQEARNRLHPLRHPQAFFQTVLDEAQAAANLGHRAAAQIEGETALRLARDRGFRIGQAMAQLFLGTLFREKAPVDLAAAGDYLSQAHEEAGRLKHRPLLWRIDLERALLAKALGQRERARNFLWTARRTFESLLEGLQGPAREGFLRDRQWERLEAEWKESNSEPRSNRE